MSTCVAPCFLGVIDRMRQPLALIVALVALLVAAVGGFHASRERARVAVRRAPTSHSRLTAAIVHTVRLMANGSEQTFHTSATTVGGFLNSIAAPVSPLTEISPEATTPLRNGMTVTLNPVSLAVTAQAVPVSFQVQTVTDSSLPQGYSEVKQSGALGEAIMRVFQVAIGGHLVRRQVVGESIVRPAQNEIVAQGTAEVARGLPNNLRVVKVLSMLATAYWADPSWSNGWTALGMRAGQGVVAVDPSVIPLGTHLFIPGYGTAIAGDTGGAIIGDRIDLGMNTGQQAIDFGERWIQVDVLGQ